MFEPVYEKHATTIITPQSQQSSSASHWSQVDRRQLLAILSWWVLQRERDRVKESLSSKEILSVKEGIELVGRGGGE